MNDSTPTKPPKAICLVSDCGKPVRTRGMCPYHYQIARTHNLLEPLPKPSGICTVEGCGSTHRVSKGLCNKHYLRQERYGDTEAVHPKTKIVHPLINRVEAKLDKNGPVFKELGSCWLWKGRKSKDGYGYITQYDNAYRVHRVTYEHYVGPIPEKLELDHLCRVRHCAAPLHLEPVTREVNRLRGNNVCTLNSKKTHCKRGHELPEERLNNGQRYCFVCAEERYKRLHPKTKK